ncbi:nuclear GTPase SLIP-GC-like [Xenentodon cancila]
MILSDVKKIMGHVNGRLQTRENTKLNAFLKSKILDLDVDKRDLVGVFGKTGAGKSSLINAVIGTKDLLPSGSVNACTSVMIKVEGNMHNTKYEAEIEFITKEEWKDELWSINHSHDNEDQEQEDDEYCEISEKLSALYGDEWKTKSPENLMDNKYFREIPEFLQSRKKIFTCESAKELSARFVKYTRSDTKQGGDKDVTRWYWPLVKCVTVKVPQNDLLQHVTLVDLPGNGDRNKSRDQMWKRMIGNCSTVWIVTEINRAASEQESWEILKDAASLLGNGGECQRIHFICTKSDLSGDLDDHSAKAIRAAIFKRNTDVKRKVHTELNKLKKHFSDDCLKVFTVSSREFFKRKLLNQEDTEIPNLQEFLRNLNDCHSETLNYVSGARGILSLIQGASRGDERKSSAAFYRVLKSAVNKFSLDTERLIHKYKNVELQLLFLKTEEEKLKSILNKVIHEGKKTVYTSLTDNIKRNMLQCYNRAAEFRGTGSLQNMRETIMRHVHESKNIMFDQAKDEMLKQLKTLMLH